MLAYLFNNFKMFSVKLFNIISQAPNNVIRYAITAGPEDMDCFIINEVNGDLMLKRPLLYSPCRANRFEVDNC